MSKKQKPLNLKKLKKISHLQIFNFSIFNEKLFQQANFCALVIYKRIYFFSSRNFLSFSPAIVA
jgi:hypothetical protein